MKVTQSTYTAILNWCIEAPTGHTDVIKFVKTNSPGSQSKSTLLSGKYASGIYYVRIEGRILNNVTGFDGFTVNGGSKMIVEYTY